MNRRQRNKHDDRMLLKRNGWEIDGTGDYLAFNSGSETITHLKGKLAAAIALQKIGYRVAGEVEKDGTGWEIDVLGYGHDSRNIIAVEIENDPTPEVVDSKKSRYYDNEPISEIFVFNPAEFPASLEGTRDHIHGELAL